MGYTRLTDSDWEEYASARSYSTATSAASLTATAVDDKKLPKNIETREARDSALNPKSLPIILACDSTASMGRVILPVIKKMGAIIKELVEKKAVEDPTIMTMFFDDVIHVKPRDHALQVTQFESDLEAVKQLEGMKITNQGGGNDSESYHLPLYMAAFKTQTDSFQKRGKRGYLFTFGDEGVPPPLTRDQIQTVFGPDESTGGKSEFTYGELLEAAQRYYDVFHVVVMGGSFAYSQGEDRMRDRWSILGQNLIVVDDVDTIPEVVISTIRMREGQDRDAVLKDWDGGTAVAVAKATSGIVKGGGGRVDDGVVVAL